MKKILSLYVLLLHIALVILLLEVNFLAKIELTVSPENPHIVNMRGINEWREKTMPDGAAVFLGDSITERLSTAAVAPSSVNFGVAWQTSAQLLTYLPKTLDRAGMIFLLIGANDIVSKNMEGLDERLAAISAALPAKVPLVWTGIMLPNATQTNETIQKICKSRPLCTYVPPLTDATFFDDGVHLSIAGYRQWIAALKSATRG